MPDRPYPVTFDKAPALVIIATISPGERASKVAMRTPSDRPAAPVVLVFDSGLGGLTVLAELAAARPDLSLIYAADDAAFPYGRLDDEALVARVTAVMDDLVARLAPELVVIACNTASTLALPVLRARFPLPFVGTVPAIKPACERSRSKRVSVIATPATVRRDYTHALIETFATGCKITLVGSSRLAGLAEAELRGEKVDDADIAAEIAPCFVDDGARTDTVVLACTHYPLLVERLRALAPWSVDWLDPAPAIARRVSSLIGPARGEQGAPGRAIFTAAQPPSPALVRALARYRLLAVETAAAAV